MDRVFDIMCFQYFHTVLRLMVVQVGIVGIISYLLCYTDSVVFEEANFPLVSPHLTGFIFYPNSDIQEISGSF